MTPQPDQPLVQYLPADGAAELSDPDCVAPDAAAELLRELPGNRLAVVGDSVSPPG